MKEERKSVLNTLFDIIKRRQQTVQHHMLLLAFIVIIILDTAQHLRKGEHTDQHRDKGYTAHKIVGIQVKRIAPLIPLMPTVARNRPIRPPIMPLITLPEETLVIMLRPKIAKAKYSGLENCSATFASCGASKIRQTVLKIPPAVLAKVERPRVSEPAAPASSPSDNRPMLSLRKQAYPESSTGLPKYCRHKSHRSKFPTASECRRYRGT